MAECPPVWVLSSVQFSRSVVSDSLWPHESQHARPPCPSPTRGVHSNSGPSSQWCHPAISSSVVPFSFCPQSLPESESFPISQLVAWGGQSIGVSALASFLPKNTQVWSPFEWIGWILVLINKVFTHPRKYQPTVCFPLESLTFHQSLPIHFWTKGQRGQSVSQFSCSVISDSLRPHELQHTRPPCPSPTLESAQTHVHWVSDAIQPSHPLPSPSSPALNLSQH